MAELTQRKNEAIVLKTEDDGIVRISECDDPALLGVYGKLSDE